MNCKNCESPISPEDHYCRECGAEIVNERLTGKGIWQNLYQFPLVELENETLSAEKIKKKLNTLLPNVSYNTTQYNAKPLIHKLSHQHLYTTFWIVEVAENIEKGIAFDTIREYPVPILIGNFIEEFNF